MNVELANQEFSDICGVKCTADKLKNALKAQQKKADDLRKKAEQATKDAIKKGTDKAKKDAENLKKEAQRLDDKLKNAGKKVAVKLKDLSGKIKGAYQKLLKKSVLTNTYILIRGNGHGIATRLYPAIISQADAKKLKYKASYVEKSKLAYAKVLSKWKELGGNPSKLNEAIQRGAKLRIAKFKKNPYSGMISGFDGEFLSMYALPFPNNSAYHNCCGRSFSGIDANGDGVDDETGLPTYMNAPASETEAVSTEDLTGDEEVALAEEGVEEASTEEKASGFQAIIAWIMNLFNRNKGDSTSSENPYEAGTPEYDAWNADIASDSYQPTDESGLNDLENKYASQAVGFDTIWGIEKPYFYGGVVVLSIGLLTGAYYLTKHLAKK